MKPKIFWFLGHRVYQHGVQCPSLQHHVQAIRDFLTRQEVKQIQQFLGMMNFFRHFLPGIACRLQPLTDALCGDPKKLSWSPAATAFQAAKDALPPAVPLAHAAPNAVLSLAADGSDSHVGGVQQLLPPSSGHTYLFTVIDKTSRTFSITAADCARACLPPLKLRFSSSCKI